MKNVLRLLVFAALATVFALPAFAQDTTPAPATPAAADPCTADPDAKAALYKKFTDNYKGTPEQQKQAYEAGKEYISKYGNCTGDKDIVAYIQNKFISKYEKAVVEFNCTKAANENPAQAFSACAPLVAANADSLKWHLALVGAGIKSYTSGNKSLNSQAAAEARTALQLIEQGKTIDTWAPFASQQDAPAGLRFYIAAWSFDNAPEEASTQLVKVAQSSSTFAKEPGTYQFLGASYYNGEFKKLADDYKRLYEGKDETPESKALYDKINLVLDRIIDAYARAVALSNGKAQYAQINTQAKNALTTFYKQRHEGSDAGMTELVASVLNKPLPIPGQEPTPAPAPPAAGTSGDGMKTAPAGTATQPASVTAPAKPAATPTPSPAKPAAASPQKPPISKTAPAANGRVAAKKTSVH